MKSASALFVSHSLNTVQRVCNAAIVLDDGDFTYYDRVREGIAVYKQMVEEQRREREEAARNNPLEIKRRKREKRLARKAAERQAAAEAAAVQPSE
jgi:ABC-type multidrug transport system ATPase subunit